MTTIKRKELHCRSFKLAFQISLGEEVSYVLKKLGTQEPPKGMKWIFCRFRKVRGNSGKVLDAREYGYEAWAFLVPCAT
jgi:hypothetical protein